MTELDNAYRTPGGRWVIRSNSDPEKLRRVDLDDIDGSVSLDAVPRGWHVMTADEYNDLLEAGTDAVVSSVMQDIARAAAERN